MKTAINTHTTSRNISTLVRWAEGKQNHTDEGNHTKTTEKKRKYHGEVDDTPKKTTNKSKNNIHEGRNDARPDISLVNNFHTTLI